jgi:hypothetical protein
MRTQQIRDRHRMPRVALATFLAIGVVVPVAQPVRAATASAAAKRAAAKTSHAEKTTSANFAASFQTFCEEWMQKLHARERDNVSHIKWESTAEGARGTYVGYSQEHKCELKENTKVGRVDYQEFTYEKRGSSVAEAQTSTPHPVEVYDATEIFHFENGKWSY